MTTVTTVSLPDTLESMRARVTDLAQGVEARSAEFEELRDLPKDVFEQLAASGATRICVPRALGGLEGTPLDWFKTVEQLAVADPAVAWIAAQGAVQNAWIGMFTETAFAREVLSNPVALPATSINGGGTLTPLPNGNYEIAGRWRFLSGVSGATLIGGLAVVQQTSGQPEMRFAVVPANQARITLNWDSMGLAGTGSHEAAVGPVEIPAGQTWVIHGTPQFASPLAWFGKGIWPIAASVAGVQLGIARRALREAKLVLRGKPQTAGYTGTNAPRSENSGLQRDFGRMAGTLDLARSGVEAVLLELWNEAQSGHVTAATQRRSQSACATAAWQSADIITRAFDMAGTSGQGRSHALQRAFRDGHTLTAHISVNDSVFEFLGRTMLMED